MSSVWDDPSMQVSGDYIKFEKVGDTVAGTIIEVSAKRWEDGSISPQLLLDTADGSKTVTAGQVRLKAALAEERPERGDYITITLSDIERRSGGKTLKHFHVKVTRAACILAPAVAGSTMDIGEATPAPAVAGSTMDIEEAKRLLGGL